MNTQETLEQAKKLETRALSSISSRFPMKTKDGGSVEIRELKVTAPKNFTNFATQANIKAKDNSLTGSIQGRVIIKNSKGETVHASDTSVELFKLPYKTQRNTYIINGNEKTLNASIDQKNCIKTIVKQSGDIETEITIDSKAAGKYIAPIKIVYNLKDGKFRCSYGRSNVNGLNFLRDCLGLTDSEIEKAIKNPSIYESIKADAKSDSKTTKTSDVFASIMGREFDNKEKDSKEIRDRILDLNNFGSGKAITMSTVGVDEKTPKNEFAKKLVERTFLVASGKQQPDNNDDLRFKTISNAEDLIINKIDKELTELQRYIEYQKADTELFNRILRKLSTHKKNFNAFMSGTSSDASGLVKNCEQINPLLNNSDAKRVTQNLDKESVTNSIRNLQVTGVSRLDPINTPESAKIGLNLELAQNARIEGGTILTTYHPVSKGVFEKDNTAELSPDDEFNRYVAFYDPKCIDKKGSKCIIASPMIGGRYQGKLQQIPRDKVEFIDMSPSSIFGESTSLIPFGNHNDGNRMMMGSKMQEQSLTLARQSREAPIVQVAVNENRDETYEKKIGEENGFCIKSPVNGTVVAVSDSEIKVKDSKGKVHTIEQYDYFPLNGGNYINSEPVVKAGDKVKQGELLADGWQTKNGELALGLNARIGYMPFKGYNYEDGIVVSRSFAKRLKTEEVTTEEYHINKDYIFNTPEIKKILVTQTNCNADLSKLDNNGLIKKGAKVGAGDILVAVAKKKDISNLSEAEQFANRLLSKDKEEYVHVFKGISVDGYTKGEILETPKIKSDGEGGHIVEVRIKSFKELKDGDKVCGRHGNKGTITKIVPDNEMPCDADGRPLELIYSPLAVPSRKNLGQLMEVNAGLIAEKTGKPYKVFNFSGEDSKDVAEKIKAISKASGGEITPDGKMYLYDPTKKGPDGKPLRYDNPVTVGTMYMIKLKHKVDEKAQARSGIDGSVNKTFLDPQKEVGTPAGEKRNPQSIGEMENRALSSHGAAFNMLETITLKGDGAGDAKNRALIYSALASKDPAKIRELEKISAQPQSLRVLKDNITSLGFQVTPLKDGKEMKDFNHAFDSLKLAPAKDEMIIKMIGKENKVTSGKTYWLNAKGVEKPEDGGLYDPKIFGTTDDEKRNKWGYIELPQAIPIPALVGKRNSSESPYSHLTPFEASEIKRIMSDGNIVVVTDPKKSNFKNGQIITVKEAEKVLFDDGIDFEFKAAGEAIEHYLSEVDVKSELADISEKLKTTTNSETIKKLYPKYRVLKNLNDNNLEAKDLVTKVIPVPPEYLRPRIGSGKTVIHSGLNNLYSDLGNFVKDTEDVKKFGFDSKDAFTAANNNAKLWQMVSQAHGIEDATRDESAKGIMKTLGSKQGLVRGRMLKKKQDYSGRSVVGVDPSLDIDEAGIPYDIAKKVFSPFVAKELVNMGKAKDERQAREIMKEDKPEVMTALKNVAEKRPVILNRAPTLHKYSIMAFKPVILENDANVDSPIRNIYTNPLINPGFNLDHDGDTMAIHVPLSDKAVKEAYDLMMPSQNLISVSNGKMIVKIRHEMALGSYYLTQKKPKSNKKKLTYNTWEQVWNDYKTGKLTDLAQPCSLPGLTNSTVGNCLFFGIIPQRYRNEWIMKIEKGQIKGMGESQCQDLLKSIYDDVMNSDPKAQGLSLQDITFYLNKIKDVSFEAATRSGLSVSVDDFTFKNNLGKEVKDKARDIAIKYKDDEIGRIKATKELQKEIESKLKSGALDESNPVNILMQSGARGNPSVIRRMGGVVGVGRDVVDRDTDSILTSHIEGLNPAQFYLHGYDSRKGMADKVLSTAVPGTMTRQIWTINQSETLVEKDCKTKEGIMVNKTDKTLIGRCVPQNVVGKDGKVIVKAGDYITKANFDKIIADDTIKQVKARSSITCESIDGTCQKCYGWEQGKVTPPPLGTAIGTIAAEALGEPLTQGTMNTFHVGGDASLVNSGLPRIKEIITSDKNKDPLNKAVLSNLSGKVTKIEDTLTATQVYIDGKIIRVPKENGRAKPLRVKVGDKVEKGDFLTAGSTEDIMFGLNADKGFTSATANQFFDAIGGDDKYSKSTIQKAQSYLATSLNNAVIDAAGVGKIDRRHIEVTINKLTENVRIISPSTSPYMTGDVLRRNVVDKWNKENTGIKNVRELDAVLNRLDLIGAIAATTYRDKQGLVICGEGKKLTTQDIDNIAKVSKKIKIIPSAIEYEPILNEGTIGVSIMGNNWLSNMATQDVGKQLLIGASYGQVDTLKDTRSRQMAGKLPLVGKGLELHRTDKDLSNSFADSLANMFK